MQTAVYTSIHPMLSSQRVGLAQVAVGSCPDAAHTRNCCANCKYLSWQLHIFSHSIKKDQKVVNQKIVNQKKQRFNR